VSRSKVQSQSQSMAIKWTKARSVGPISVEGRTEGRAPIERAAHPTPNGTSALRTKGCGAVSRFPGVLQGGQDAFADLSSAG